MFLREKRRKAVSVNTGIRTENIAHVQGQILRSFQNSRFAMIEKRAAPVGGDVLESAILALCGCVRSA